MPWLFCSSSHSASNSRCNVCDFCRNTWARSWITCHALPGLLFGMFWHHLEGHENELTPVVPQLPKQNSSGTVLLHSRGGVNLVPKTFSLPRPPRKKGPGKEDEKSGMTLSVRSSVILRAKVNILLYHHWYYITNTLITQCYMNSAVNGRR